MDRDGYLHAALLSLLRFQGAHNGFNQEEHIWRTIEDCYTLSVTKGNRSCVLRKKSRRNSADPAKSSLAEVGSQR